MLNNIIKIINRGNERLKKTIEVSVYVTQHCNQSCDYCIVKNDIIQKSNNKIFYNVEELDIFKNLKNLNDLKLKINFLGGEPTFIQNFDELYHKILELIKIIPNLEACFLTNGTFNIEHHNSLPFNKNISYLISFHPDFMSFKRLKLLNEKLLKNKKFSLLMKYDNHSEIDKSIEYFLQNNYENFEITPLYGRELPLKYKQLFNTMTEDMDSDYSTGVELGKINKCYVLFYLRNGKIVTGCDRRYELKDCKEYIDNGIICCKHKCLFCGGKSCYVEVLK